MNDVVIHKFGGSCLRDSSDLDNISRIIKSQPSKIVIVVSALWGTTDRLLRAANEPRYATKLVSDLRKQHLRFSPKIDQSMFADKFNKVLNGIDKSLFNLSKNPDSSVDVDSLLAAGERLSALVVANELRKQGLDANAVGAEDVGICLDGTDTATNVDIEKSVERLDHSAFRGIPVITGWFGEGIDGNLALLGRGGSDHTAAAIARILDAKKLILWKDVEGVLSINPRWGVDSKPIPYLGYDEARELSRVDAPVIHHTTMIPVKDYGIPIEIRNLHSASIENAPTVIGPNIIQSNHLKAIGCMRSVAKITAEIGDIANQTKVLGQILIQLDQENITCWSVKSSPSKVDFVVSQQELSSTERVIEKNLPIANIEYYSCLISFIGTNKREIVDERMSKMNSIDTELSYLDSTDLSIQYVCNTNDIKGLMNSLSKIVFEKPKA